MGLAMSPKAAISTEGFLKCNVPCGECYIVAIVVCTLDCLPTRNVIVCLSFGECMGTFGIHGGLRLAPTVA